MLPINPFADNFEEDLIFMKMEHDTYNNTF